MGNTVDRRRGANVDHDGMMQYQLGWKDNLASFASGKTAGANVPAWAAIRDGVYAYEFSATLMKEVWIAFHVGHDYAPGTDLYPHIHFVPSSDEIEGTVRWGVEYTIAKRDSGYFPETTTVYIEQVVAANSQYQHIVSEVSDADAIKGEVNGNDNVVEVDMVIMCRFFRDADHDNDTYAGTVFGIFADLHYQADRDATIDKAFPFYG
jgi:hypothetical protein